MRAAWWFLGLAALGAATVSAHQAGASATVDPDRQEPRTVQSHEAALQTDLELYSELYGVDLDRALRDHHNRLSVQPLLDVAAEDSDYSFAQVDRAGVELVVVIGFKDAAPEDVVRAAIGLPVRLVSTGWSRDEREASVSRISTALVEQEFSNFGTSLESRTGRIRISVGAEDVPRSARDEFEANLLEIGRPAELTFEYVNGSVGGGEHTYGGDEMPRSPNPNVICTSGFTTANDRVLTAAHCANDRDYRENSAASYDAPFDALGNRSWGDFQAHTTGHDEYDDFYYNRAVA
jgi:V8-like Glu-specific endopeptidase